MEQLGASYVGNTNDSQLISSTGVVSLISCVIVGGQDATYPQGAAMVDSATPGLKKRYRNVSGVAATYTDTTGVLALNTGDGAKLSVGDYIYVDSSKIEKQRVKITAINSDNVTISPKLGADDTLVEYHNDTTGACILAEDVTTTATGGNVTTNAYVEGNIKADKVVDSQGAAVDQYFKAALPKVRFE